MRQQVLHPSTQLDHCAWVAARLSLCIHIVTFLGCVSIDRRRLGRCASAWRNLFSFFGTEEQSQRERVCVVEEKKKQKCTFMKGGEAARGDEK